MRIVLGAFVTTTMLFVAACSTTQQNPIYQQSTKYKGSNPYTDKAVVQQATYQRQVQTQAPAPVTYASQQTGYATAPQTVTYAANSQQAFQDCISKESTRKVIGTAAGGVVGGLVGRKLAGDNKTLGTIGGAALGGAAGYGIADKTIRCDRAPAVVQAAPTYQPAPAYQTAPTYQSAQPATYQASSVTPVPQAQTGIQENTESFGDGGTPGYYAVNGLTPPAQTSVGQAAPQQYAQIQTLNPQQIVPEPMPVPTGFRTLPTQAGTIRHRVITGDTLYSLARTTCSSVAEIQQINSINSEFYIRVGDDIMVPSGRCVE